MPNSPIVDASSLYVSGLVMASVSTPTVSIGPGSCRDSTDTNDIKVASSLLLDLRNSGVNGFDIGTNPTNTLIKVFVIGDSTGYRESASIASAKSSLSPVLPFGYDMFRRVGHLKTFEVGEHSDFCIAGEGRNKWHYMDRAFGVGGGSSTTFDDLDCSLLVPPLSATFFSANFAVDAPGALLTMRTKGSGQLFGNSISLGQVAGVNIISEPTFTTDLNSFIQYKVSGGSVEVAVHGFLDAL